MKLRIISCFLLWLPIISYAQKASSVQPTTVHIYRGANTFIFYATVNEGQPPTCSGLNRWAVKLDSTAAKEIISMVVSAKVSGRNISVLGDGTCDVSGQGYSIDALWIE